MTLQQQFGNIDIYLFDQLLRGNIRPGMKIFDAGCGGGRNIVYFLREGYEVYACDQDPQAVEFVRSYSPTPDHIRCEPLEEMSFPSEFADVVISCAVLHFAEDDTQFAGMLSASWRVLRPGGLFFCRLASSIGIEKQIIPAGENRYLLPDGSSRYLADEKLLQNWARRLGGNPVDPLKTTIVQGQRAMTTWVLQKS